MNTSGLIPKEWQLNQLPLLDESEKVYSLLDNKRLFNMGINIQNLKSERPMLENLIYAPLENPWWSSGIILGGIGITLAILCGFKGKLLCCARNSNLKVASTPKQRSLEENLKRLDNLELGIMTKRIHLEPENQLQKKGKPLDKVEWVGEDQINKSLKEEDRTLTETATRTLKVKGQTRGGKRVY